VVRHLHDSTREIGEVLDHPLAGGCVPQADEVGHVLPDGRGGDDHAAMRRDGSPAEVFRYLEIVKIGQFRLASKKVAEAVDGLGKQRDAAGLQVVQYCVSVVQKLSNSHRDDPSFMRLACV